MSRPRFILWAVAMIFVAARSMEYSSPEFTISFSLAPESKIYNSVCIVTIVCTMEEVLYVTVVVQTSNRNRELLWTSG